MDEENFFLPSEVMEYLHIKSTRKTWGRSIWGSIRWGIRHYGSNIIWNKILCYKDSAKKCQDVKSMFLGTDVTIIHPNC